MSYTKTTWKDRNIEKPNTYSMQKNSDGTITLIPSPGQVIEAGTPINAINMNKIEDELVNINSSLDNKASKTDVEQKIYRGESGVIVPSMLSQETKEMMTSNAVAVVGKDAITPANVSQKSIKPSALSDDMRTELCDYNTVIYEWGTTDGYYNSALTFVASSNYKTSKPITCKIGDEFLVKQKVTGSSAYRLALLDVNGNCIEVIGQGISTDILSEKTYKINNANAVSFVFTTFNDLINVYVKKLEIKFVDVKGIKDNISNINSLLDTKSYHYEIYSKHDSSSYIRIKYVYDSGDTLAQNIFFEYTVEKGVSNISTLDMIVQASANSDGSSPTIIISNGNPVTYNGTTTINRSFTKPVGTRYIIAYVMIKLVDGNSLTKLYIDNVKVSNLSLSSFSIYDSSLDPTAYAIYKKVCPFLTSDDINTSNSNPLWGKKLGGLGDSLMSTVYTGVGNEWLSLIGKRNNMTVYNHAISGNPISTDADCMAVRYVNMPNDLDYIIVMGGANDLNRNAPIGTNTDNDITTFKGALNVLIKGLISKYPRGKIVFCTNYNRYPPNDQRYVDAMLEICALYSVPCHDNFRKSNVYMTNTEWMKIYGANPNDSGNKHLNTEGDIRVSTMYEALLKSL